MDSLENVQKIFDRVLPEKGAKKTPPPPVEPEKAVRPPVDRTPPPPPEPAKEEPSKMPAFVEDFLKVDVPPREVKPPADADPSSEWAEDLPPVEKQSRIKGLRDAYRRVKTELDAIKSNPLPQTPDFERMAALEYQNRQMADMLSRVGVEHSEEFQNQIMRPLYASWNEAARIVHDAGGNPEDLRAAMSLSGRAQFEALDNLFAEFPDSAKSEAHDALRSYRRFESARAAAVANAPDTMKGIRQRESQRQYQELGRARNEMKAMFDNALSKLRDEAKVEVFLKTNDPDTQWWNQQGDQVVEQARNLFLENTDLNKVAFACLLAPAADAYRNLFMKSQKQVAELRQIIKEKGWSEPNLSESSGNAGNLTPERQLSSDLKRPFSEVFLDEFHRQQQKNR